MSYDYTRACLTVPVEGAAKAVLLALCGKADKRGRSWPSIDSLVLYTGWKRTSVIEGVQKLEEDGLITVVRSHGRSSLYTVQLEEMRARVMARGGDGLDDDDEGDDDGAGSVAVPTQPVRGADQSAGRTSPPGEPHQSARRTYQSAGRTRSVNNCQELSNTPQPPQAGGEGGDGFAEFWDAYPRQEAIERARRRWRRLRPDAALQARILAALALQRLGEAWKREDGRFIPLPARWLREERWCDVAPVDRQRASRPLGWQDDPGEVKRVGESLGLPYSLAGLGSGWTDDERAAHWRRYRAQVIALAQGEAMASGALRCPRCGREGHNSEDCKVQLPREAASTNTKGMQC